MAERHKCLGAQDGPMGDIADAVVEGARKGHVALGIAF